jgi:flagellar biosynthesis protein FlhF
MNTSKFSAPTMREVLAKVKAELGEDAVILKSEKIKAGGGVNFLKRELIEVTAARPGDVKEELQSGPEFAETLDKSLTPDPDSRRSARSSYEIGLLKDEVNRLREDIGVIGKHFKYSNLPAMPEELTRMWEAMTEAGVESEWATDLAQNALVNLDANELISADAIENYMLRQFSSFMPPVNQPIRRRRTLKIALVGSPGAGKTTTLQKLAADPEAYGKRKVGILSFDTYRMAAIEQIRSFARVAGTPLEIVYQPEQAMEALNRLADCEIILIDTAGCTVNETAKFEQTRKFLEAIDPDETHLVMNSCVRDAELIFAASRFRDLNVSHLTFTRLD